MPEIILEQYSISGGWKRMLKKIFLITVLLLLSLEVVSADLTTNLVAGYNLDETTGTLQASVLNTNNLTASDSNVIGATGIINHAAYYNGSTYSTESSPSGLPTGSSVRTISFWTNRISDSQGGAIVAMNAASGQSFLLMSQDSTNTFFTDAVNGNNNIQYSGFLTNGEWINIVFEVTSSTTYKVYRNGVDITSSTNLNGNFGTPINTNTISTLELGRRASSSQYYNGIVDAVYIWNRTLNSTEVAQLYNSGAGLQYPFTTYFTITASDNNTGTPIQSFNATVSYANGTNQNYTTTNGTINTNINQSLNWIANVTLASQYFLNGTTWNWNTNTNLNTSLSALVNLTASDLYDNSTISNFSVSIDGGVSNYTTTNGVVTLQTIARNDTSTHNFTYTFTNYYNTTATNINVSSGFINTTAYQAIASFNASEIISILGINGFTVTAPLQSNTNTTPTLYLKAGTYNITFNLTGWYNLTNQFTIPDLTNTTYNFNNTYRYILNITAKNNITGLAENNFTAIITSGLYNYTTTYNTTNGSVIVPWTNDTNINITLVNASTLATTNILWNTSNYTATPTVVNISIQSVTTNSINILFLDETNQSKVNQVITAYINSAVYATNFTTSNSSQFVSFITPSTYSIVYGAPGYNQRTYVTTVTNQTTQNLVLYLRPSTASTVVLMYVTSQSVKVPGAIVNAYVKNLSGTNTYLVDQCTTDINGQCLMSLDVSTSTTESNTSYNFVVVYNNVTVGTSGYTKVSNTASTACNSNLPCVQLLVSLGSSSLANFFGTQGLQYSRIGYDRVNTFTFNFTDSTNTVQQICLTTTMRTGAILTQTNQSCVNSAIGNLVVFTNTSLGDENIATAQVLYGGLWQTIDTYEVPSAGAGSVGSVLMFLVLGLGLISVVFFAYKEQATLALVMVAGILNILLLISALSIITKGFVITIELIIMFVIWRMKE